MSSSTSRGHQAAPQPVPPPTIPCNNSPPLVTSRDLDSGVCRDFIWGICTMGTQCSYRHELKFETMKSVLKFCHDHQNPNGCTRPNCTYLHTSREEHNLFLTTGQIPNILATRYSHTSAEEPPFPHHMPFKHRGRPRPLTPAMAEVGSQNHTIKQQLIHSSVQGPMQELTSRPKLMGPVLNPKQGRNSGPMKSPLHGLGPMPISMPFYSMTMPLPPPPPPPPKPTSSMSSTRRAAPVHSSPHPTHQSSLFRPAMPHPTLLPMFDPTRPPPPIPQTNPGPLKRDADEYEAVPSKVRKVEATNDSCECCVRLLIRTDQLTQRMSRLELEAEQVRSELAEKMDNYEKKKEVLRSILGTGVYRQVLEYIQNGSMVPFLMRNEARHTNSISSPMPSPLDMNSNIQQILSLLMDVNTSGLTDSMPVSTESDVGFLPAASQPRLSNSSREILMLLDLLRQVPSGASGSGPSEAELSLAVSSGSGFSRFLGTGGAVPTPHFPPPPPPPPPAPADTASPAQSHCPPTTHLANPPYPGAALSQPLRPPMPPQQPQNSLYSGEASYPNQHYYPPYQ